MAAELLASQHTGALTVKQSTLPQIARLAVSMVGAPKLHHAISVGAAVRGALIQMAPDQVVFHGHAPDCRPAQNHQHLHVFCESQSGGTIHRITLYAPMGFNGIAQKAIGRLNRIWGPGLPAFQVMPTGLFAHDDTGLFAKAKYWVSLTPYVCPRYPKRPQGSDGLIEQVARELALKGLPNAHIERFITQEELPDFWRNFKIGRPEGGGKRGPLPPSGLILKFDRAVQGPLTLGYGAHFGLGLFIPVPEGVHHARP